jgi:NitT/TauT family transport system ATP-binding protein
MIELTKVFVQFQTGVGSTVEAVEDANFVVETGKCVALVGPSGCGKSTILDCIAGLVAPTHGNVQLGAFSAKEARDSHKIAYVGQRPVFFDWFSAQRNIEIAGAIAGLGGDITRHSDLLDQFGLLEFADALPHQLSGGMLARLALARAFASQPEFLLLDEAFNFLDEMLRAKINDDVQTYMLKAGCTTVVVTHSVSEAVYLADRVLVLSARPARIVEVVESRFPRPRERSLTKESDFVALCDHIRSTLGTPEVRG